MQSWSPFCAAIYKLQELRLKGVPSNSAGNAASVPSVFHAAGAQVQQQLSEALPAIADCVDEPSTSRGQTRLTTLGFVWPEVCSACWRLRHAKPGSASWLNRCFSPGDHRETLICLARACAAQLSLSAGPADFALLQSSFSWLCTGMLCSLSDIQTLLAQA